MRSWMEPCGDYHVVVGDVRAPAPWRPPESGLQVKCLMSFTNEDIFNERVNILDSVKSIEHQAVAALGEALGKVPAIMMGTGSGITVPVT